MPSSTGSPEHEERASVTSSSVVNEHHVPVTSELPDNVFVNEDKEDDPLDSNKTESESSLLIENSE